MKWSGIVGSVILVSTLVGCAAPGSRDTSGAGAGLAVSQAPKRLTLALSGAPPGMHSRLNPAGTSTPGLAELMDLTSPGLSAVDSDGGRVPLLAQSIPSTAAGSWTVGADGTMVTTWKLRPGITWHDGAPFTTNDLLFAATLGRDPQMSEFGHRAYSMVDRVEATDALTITTYWKKPYVEADTMFTAFAEPLPEHILRPIYAEGTPKVRESAYWTTEFVGSGPFQLREFVPAISTRLEAYANYVLGRPKIDIVDVRFIPDTQTMVANVLAGDVDMTIGRGFSLEQGMTLKDRWEAGKVSIGVTENWIPIYPQLLDPTPAVVTNPQFRRALTHSMDRQAMSNAVQNGLVPVADSIIAPNQLQYAQIESRIVKYAYDPRRATQIMEELGLVKGSDGKFRDGAGERLNLEIRYVTSTDTTRLLSLASADAWTQFGIDTQPLVIPTQLNQDRAYRATFPSFELVNQGAGASAVANLLHSSGASLPSNDYRPPSGAVNRSRYMNKDYDGLLERYSATIPMAERTRALGDIIHFQTEQALLIGTVFALQPQPIPNRIKNAAMGNARGVLILANAHEWDVA